MNKPLFFRLIFFLTLSAVLSAQEALKSVEEEYYDFLSLQGLTERPALNYRTLSDSVWNIDETAEHPWQRQKLAVFHPLFGDFRLRVYGPELFTSYNTAAPYGQNDGVLWQGRGFNSLFKSGVRFEGYGLELTLLPHFAFSQNTDFDYIQANVKYRETADKKYTNKAEKYGYYGIYSIDAPQRFGDESFFDWDFGDSEIRYTWKTLTVGFGTQVVWLGPAQLNPVIHSNNAAAYPKFDIGLRRQPIFFPNKNRHLGDIEFRIWWGYLSESDWFDNDTSDDHNLITGFSFAYSFPSLLKGLTIGFNRIMLSKWDNHNYFGALGTIVIPIMSNKFGEDTDDQRASVIIDYLLPVVGIDIYLEWGRNDFSGNIDSVIRYPFHTQGYTFGTKKSLLFSSTLKGEILLELTNLECSQDYDRVIPWYSTFYAHQKITQGHTNRGQWLGAGIGTGGNSQYLGFKLYFPKGYGNIFFQRRNPDLDYTWYIDSKNPGEYDAEWNIRAFFDIGISGQYYFIPYFSINSSLVFRDEHNPLNKSAQADSSNSAHRYNLCFAATVKYTF